MNKRRTLTYFHSECGDVVRAPHTRIPCAANFRMTSTPATFSASESASLNSCDRPVTPTRTSFAGAFHTPRSVSVLAYTPAIWPHGGTITFDAPSREGTSSHGW